MVDPESVPRAMIKNALDALVDLDEDVLAKVEGEAFKEDNKKAAQTCIELFEKCLDGTNKDKTVKLSAVVRDLLAALNELRKEVKRSRRVAALLDEEKRDLVLGAYYHVRTLSTKLDDLDEKIDEEFGLPGV